MTAAARGESTSRPSAGLGLPALAGIGTLGVVLFVVGIVYPILARIPYALYLRFAAAIAGGALAMYGWGRYREVRLHPMRPPPGPAPRPSDQIPSLEVYVPPTAGRGSTRRRPKAEILGPVGSETAPHRRFGSLGSRRPLLAGVVLMAIVALLLFPGFGPLGAGRGGSGTPTSRSPAPPVPGAPSPGHSGVGLAATPVCSIFYPPPYQTFNGLYPPLPKYSVQSPCKTPHDELHLTFSSGLAASGQNVRVPVYLPRSGIPGQSSVYGDIYVGMVVQGDPLSVDGQSYAELVFLPQGAGSIFHWDLAVAVWSLLLNTRCTTVVGGVTVPSGLNVSYNNNFGCVYDDVGNGNGTYLSTTLPAGTWANVTFIGSATLSNHPLTVFFNDSTGPTNSTSYTFNSAHTKSYSFQPKYVTSCPTYCLLNWSTPFGLGVGVDLCETGPCFSYNASTQLTAPPIEVGSPESWTGLNYSGDYQFLGPVSSTGACSGVSTVVPCDASATAGTYPSFTFNGSQIDFGANYSWTSHDFGGPYVEFNALGTENQYAGLFLDELSNSSRAGYVAPSTPLNVSARIQDLGNVSVVNLTYTLPGQLPINESMSLVTGLPSNGLYNATVPATGSDGTIAFRVWATNAAGIVLGLPDPGSGPATVNRTPIPNVTVRVETVPPGCGGVSLGGGPILGNGTVRVVLAGFYSVSATGCYPYNFGGWHTTGGVSVAGTSPNARLEAHANGTVEATWVYYRPYDTVQLAFSPANCGAIDLNGTVFPAGTPWAVPLLDAGTYLLGAGACSGESFSGWTVTNPTNLSILGPAVTLHGNGTITALFVSSSSSYPVGFATSPTSCGGVELRQVGYVTGESLNLLPGTYGIGPAPCAGWGFNGTVTTTGSVSVAAGTLTVNGAGSVAFWYYKLTLVTLLTQPASCGQILWDGQVFGNDVVLNVTNHTQHSIAGQPCSGYYLSGVNTTGGVHLQGPTTVIVDGPGAVKAFFRPGSPVFFVSFLTTPNTCGAIVFQGTAYNNSQQTSVAPGTVAPVSAISCTGYGFVRWSVSGTGFSLSNGLAYVNGSGSLTAIFHPLVEVAVFTQPANCGSVDLNGVSVPNNGTAELPQDNTYPILPEPCAYQRLSNWQTSAGATVVNGILTLTGTATITAVFAPQLYPVQLRVSAGGCGQVIVAGVSYAAGTNLSLAAGAYPITANLCTGYTLTSWGTTPNLSVAGSTTATLTVHGPGTITAVGAAVPPTLSLLVPVTAAAGSSVVLTANVAVPLPPFNYSYAWSFGDGSNATTAGNTTTHVYARPGTYLLQVSVVDPLGRHASSSTNVAIVAVPAGPTFALSPSTAAVVALAAGLIVAGALAAVVRSRRSARRGSDAGAPFEGSEPTANEYPRA